jgi:hypothetical protein
MYTEDQLWRQQVARNLICAPWLYHPLASPDITGDTSSFAFVDRDWETTRTMKKAQLAVFRKPVTFVRWVSPPSFTSAAGAYKLGHTSNRCSMPRDAVKCYKYGKIHSARDYDV